MIRTKIIVKFFTMLICTSEAILATEQISEADPSSPSQVLTIELKTLTPEFGLKTFFRDKKRAANMHELKLAEQAYWIAERMLNNKEGEKTLTYVGYSLYLGYPKIINIIYDLGFRGYYYEGFSPTIKQEIKDKFLEACNMHGISSAPYLLPLRSKYEEAWEENKHRIERIEAEQKQLERTRRWWTPSGFVGRMQHLLGSHEQAPFFKLEETGAYSESEKGSKKRTRTKDNLEQDAQGHSSESFRQPGASEVEIKDSPTLDPKKEK